MRALLDVNVLLALLDTDHADHRIARSWLSKELAGAGSPEGGPGWASCALTQNGFVRIISQPRYPSPIPTAQAIDRLGRATRNPLHEFWSCEISLLDAGLIERDRIYGPKQITDLYLLALAVAKGGRFVTFDRAISRHAVSGALASHLVVLG